MSPSYHVLFLLLCFFLPEPSQAIKQSYIVYLGSHSFGPYPSLVEMESATNSHYDLLGSYLGSTEMARDAIFYSYNRNINGFAAILDEEDASRIAEHPNVVSVFLNKRQKLQTTHSWEFLGLETNGVISNNSIWKKGFGEDVIIANIDTGVWPESKSFSDEGMGPIPKRWHGICQTDDRNTDKFNCNRKLIGARYFYEGYKASSDVNKNVSFYSARDYNGHGSHTLSIAAGNFVSGVSVFGQGNGIASGASPKARVASYKVCWEYSSCNDADILAAIEATITDGVDVISLSLAPDEPKEYFNNSIAIGTFHAFLNGLVVVSGAGNYGPKPSTILNSEPWVNTVAASTTDRDFTSTVILGDNKTLEGVSISMSGLSSHEFYPLIKASDANADNVSSEIAAYCANGDNLDHKKVKGKILVCIDPYFDQTWVDQTGVVGVIYLNTEPTRPLYPTPIMLPASNLNYTESKYFLNYINHTKSPTAVISKAETNLGIKPSPKMVVFSSRGPDPIEPRILKPDITAPGFNIIAANTEANSPSGSTNTPFKLHSGTSMSCPHVSGLVVLLKALHSDWSSAAIKSAIMTTATPLDNTGRPILDYNSHDEATPFAYGSGHIQPNLVADPGLVYDLTTNDYLNFLCAHGYNSSTIGLLYRGFYVCPRHFKLVDFNYPSITIPNLHLGHSIHITRTLTNVGPPSTYNVYIQVPNEVVVSVNPRILVFQKKGDRKDFRLTLSLKPQINNKVDYFIGSLVWNDGKHNVRSPIIVKNPHK